MFDFCWFQALSKGDKKLVTSCLIVSFKVAARVGVFLKQLASLK